MKLLEDQQSYDRLGNEAADIFQTIQFPKQSPKGEDQQTLCKYHEVIKDLYAHRPGFDDYQNFFAKFTSPQYGEVVIHKALELSKQPQTHKAILAIYDQTLKEVADARGTNKNTTA